MKKQKCHCEGAKRPKQSQYRRIIIDFKYKFSFFTVVIFETDAGGGFIRPVFIRHVAT